MDILSIVIAIVIAFLVIVFFPYIARVFGLLLMAGLVLAIGGAAWFLLDKNPEIWVLLVIGTLVYFVSWLFSLFETNGKSVWTDDSLSKRTPENASSSKNMLKITRNEKAFTREDKVTVAIILTSLGATVIYVMHWLGVRVFSLDVLGPVVVFLATGLSIWMVYLYAESHSKTRVSEPAEWSGLPLTFLLFRYLSLRDFICYAKEFLRFSHGDLARYNRRKKLNELIERAIASEAREVRDRVEYNEKQKLLWQQEQEELSEAKKARYLESVENTFSRLTSDLESTLQTFTDLKLIELSKDQNTLSIEIIDLESEEALVHIRLLTSEQSDESNKLKVDIRSKDWIRARPVTIRRSIRICRKIVRDKFL